MCACCVVLLLIQILVYSFFSQQILRQVCTQNTSWSSLKNETQRVKCRETRLLLSGRFSSTSTTDIRNSACKTAYMCLRCTFFSWIQNKDNFSQHLFATRCFYDMMSLQHSSVARWWMTLDKILSRELKI